MMTDENLNLSSPIVQRVLRLRKQMQTHSAELSKIDEVSYRLLFPANAIQIMVALHQEGAEPIPLALPSIHTVEVGQSIIAHLVFSDTNLPLRTGVSAHADRLDFTPETVRCSLEEVETQGGFTLFIEQAQKPVLETSRRKTVRLYLIGFSEAAWEELKPLFNHYPSIEMHFETVLKRSVGLVVCLLITIDDFDPNFFNGLRIEKRIAWWEYAYPGKPPTTIWLHPNSHHRGDMKSD